MSESGSVAGSQSSLRSSFKGWSSREGGTRTGGRQDDMDGTRSSSSSYTSSRALAGPLQLQVEGKTPPASSSLLALAGAGTGTGTGTGTGGTGTGGTGGLGSKTEDQLKKERIWWSEHALVEVQRLELSVKQELQKTTGSLREQFRRQLEIERNDSQLRDSSLERAITRLTDDLRALEGRMGHSAHWEQDRSAIFQQLDEERAARLRQIEAVREETQVLAVKLIEERTSQTQSLIQSAMSAASAHASSGPEDGRIQELVSVIEAECTQRKGEVDALRSELSREQDLRSLEVNEANEAWRSETQRLAQELASVQISAKVSQEMVTSLEAGWREHKEHQLPLRLEQLQAELQNSIRESLAEPAARASNVDGGETVRKLAGYLEAECKSRQTDVEDLRSQLSLLERRLIEFSAVESLQAAVESMDLRLGNLAGALDTERETRKSDSERHEQAQDDLRAEMKDESRLQKTEVEKVRSAVADLALNSSMGNSGDAATEASQAPDPHMANGSGGILRSDVSAALGRVNELVARVGSLGVELRSEFGSRLELMNADLSGEIAAARVELQGEAAAKFRELREQLSSQLEGLVQELRGAGQGGAGALQSNVVVTGQLGEVARVLQEILASSEVLADRICSESSTRRANESRFEVRLSAVEQRLTGGSVEESLPSLPSLPSYPEMEPPIAGSRGSPMAGSRGEPQQRQQQLLLQHQLQEQTLISEDLKTSLETLVTRVNRMLKPEEAAAAGWEGSSTPAVRSSASRPHSPERQRSGIFHLGQEAGFGVGASKSGAPTPSQPEAAARHPANAFSASLTPGGLGAKLGPRRAGSSTPSTIPMETKLMHKAVQDLYQENSQLRDELNGQGSPQNRGGAQAEAHPAGNHVGSVVIGSQAGAAAKLRPQALGGGQGSPRPVPGGGTQPQQQGSSSLLRGGPTGLSRGHALGQGTYTAQSPVRPGGTQTQTQTQTQTLRRGTTPANTPAITPSAAGVMPSAQRAAGTGR